MSISISRRNPRRVTVVHVMGAWNAKEDITAKLIATFKQLISEGSLVPGCKLPAERDLAESFGVARSSLRPALKVLEIMGVISQRVGDGTYLNTAAASILGEPLEFLVLLDGISFHELMEARLIVEPELAARAAVRATDDDVAELQRIIAEMAENRSEIGRFIKLDVTFHQAIFRVAGNRVCDLMFTVVHESLQKLIGHTVYLVNPEHTLNLHRRILSAIRKRDPEDARRRTTEHLLDVRKLLRLTAEEQVHSKLQDRISALSATSGGAAKTASSHRRRRTT